MGGREECAAASLPLPPPTVLSEPPKRPENRKCHPRWRSKRSPGTACPGGPGSPVQSQQWSLLPGQVQGPPPASSDVWTPARPDQWMNGHQGPYRNPGVTGTFVAAAVRGPGVDGGEEGLGSACSRVPGSAELHGNWCPLTSKGLRGCTHAGSGEPPPGEQASTRPPPARGAGLHPAPTSLGSSWASTPVPTRQGSGPPPGPHPPGVFLGT